ncbi:Ig-like domain repeat protein [Streptomyces fragilis]|uniref:Ig-like domain repeat protein n=1 Tax=Streptomyces fragilis TaxID=67301 RepID=A0ABV2YEI0_9ACTN|nr:Ig-like domain repeat protein [Streptomyces fragilis]
MNVYGARGGGRVRTALLAVVMAGAGLTATAGPAAAGTAPEAGTAGTVVKLPVSSFSQFAVDAANRRVWIADENTADGGRGPGTILGYDFDGVLRAQRQTEGRVSGIAAEPGGARVLVGQRDGIQAFDAELSPLGVTPAPVDDCGRELFHAGHLLFFTSQEGASPQDCAEATAMPTVHATAADGTEPRTVMYLSERGHLEAGPTDMLMIVPERSASNDDPNINLYRVVEENEYGGVLDFLGETWLSEDGTGLGGLDFRDAAFSPDGSTLAFADPARGTALLTPPGLSARENPYAPLPEGAEPTAVAYSGDGTWFARGAAASGDAADLLLGPADPADTRPPVEVVLEGEGGDRVVPRGVEFAPDGRSLFVVTTDAAGTGYWLHVIPTPDGLSASRFADGTSQEPARATAGERVTLRGRLELDGPAPADAPRIEVVREDADGAHALESVTAGADGAFTVSDVPQLVGEATYRFSYAGDGLHKAAEDARVTVPVAKASAALELTAPAEATRKGGVEITGALRARGLPLAAPATLTVTAADRDGVVRLAPVTAGADGTFTVRHAPRSKGDVTYTVTWAGDALHEGAEASATVRVRR